jgi:hypothetical protein
VNNEIVKLQTFLEGFYNVVDPSKVLEIFSLRKNQNTGTGTTLFGMTGRSVGTFAGATLPTWNTDGNSSGVHFGNIASAINATNILLPVAPVSIIAVIRIVTYGSKGRFGHAAAGGDTNRYFAQMNYWGGPTTTGGFGARSNINSAVVIPSPVPGDGWIPTSIATGPFHYVMMSLSATQAGKFNLDGGTDITGTSSSGSWNSYINTAPFTVVSSVPGASIADFDVAFVAFLSQDISAVSGTMASVKLLLSSTLCAGLP